MKPNILCAHRENVFSISTADVIMCLMMVGRVFGGVCENIRHANSVCRRSSCAMNSLALHNPDIIPRPLSQKIEAKEEDKNIPLAVANAAKRVAGDSCSLKSHCKAQRVFAATVNICSLSLMSDMRSFSSGTRVHINIEYVSSWMFPLERWISAFV